MPGTPPGSLGPVADAIGTLHPPLEAVQRALSETSRGADLAPPFRRIQDRFRDLAAELEGEPRCTLYTCSDAAAECAHRWLAPMAAELRLPLADGDLAQAAASGDVAILAIEGKEAGDPSVAAQWKLITERHAEAHLLCMVERWDGAITPAFAPLEILHAELGRDGARRILGSIGAAFPEERAQAAIDELLETCRQPELAHHADRWRTFEPVLRADSKLRKAVSALAAADDNDWEGSLERLNERLTAAHIARIPELVDRAVTNWSDALAEWANGDAGLPDLIDGELLPIQESVQERMWTVVRTALVCEVAEAEESKTDWFPPPLMEAAEQAEVSLGSFAMRAVRSIPRISTLRPVVPLLDVTDIPLRTTLSFSRLVRGDAAIRNKVFGPEGARLPRIPQADKSRHLAGDLQESLIKLVRERLKESARDQLERSAKQLTGFLARHVRRALRRKVRAKIRRLDSAVSSVERLFTDPANLGRHLATLEQAALQAGASLTAPSTGRAVATHAEATPVSK